MSKLIMTTVQLQKVNLTLAQCQEAIDFVREQVPDIVHIYVKSSYLGLL